MTISETGLRAFALQLKTHPGDFDRNITRLAEKVRGLPEGSLVVTPEVFVTGYPYDRLDDAANSGEKALSLMTGLSKGKIVTLTLIVKEKGRYYNRSFVFHDGNIVHTQNKVKLFLLGEEDRYLTAGSMEEIRPFEIDGIRFGLTVCFELRYPEIWLRLRGADAILVPARWGLPRKKHLEAMSRALGIANQCYCIVANSGDDEMARSSAIVTPNGDMHLDDLAETIEGRVDLRSVKKIRRYIKMG
ncbi:nitrilase-related carbon-nitrogen hydrolase [Hydrogenimonas sp. SS33]|uniref:nitrilase-related carbon-nitrogen hydrolase n=1 Tax=Hydrogenimonas leucolamina TaxID=2954236 RepID=UPI00336BD9FD